MPHSLPTTSHAERPARAVSWRVTLLAGAAVGALVIAAAPTPPSAWANTPTVDPRAGDPDYERSQQLFGALRDILDEAARLRLERRTAPESALEELLYRQMGIDQKGRIRELLGSAFEMMTDTDVVDIQRDIAKRRDTIRELRGGVGELKERRISAPDDAGWESWIGMAEDRGDIDAAIEDLESRISQQEMAIAAAKDRFAEAMKAAGADLPSDQIDLLLESVTGSDLVELAAAYEAVRGVSEQLRKLMDESGEDLTYAKRYYGMHTALIALLLEAQGGFIGKIDHEYLPKLDAIERDIDAAAAETDRLMKDDPTRDQRRALSANRESQLIAKDALAIYREVLERQRAEIADAHRRTEKELRVADNTLRTVDASFQLRQVMESAASSFETLRSLETPGFDRVFRNERLRREFQELTDKLEPSS